MTDAWCRPSSARSSHPDRSGSSNPCSRVSCPSACDPAGPGRRSSASRRRSPWPFASASGDRSRRCRAARSSAGQRWLPSSSRRRRSARPSPNRARQRETEPSRKPFRGPRAAGASVSSTARNDRQPCRGSPGAGTREATANPNNANRCRARCRYPRNSRPCACGNSGRAAMTAHPSSAHSTACTDPRQKRRSRPLSTMPAAGRRRRVPENEASQPRSQRGRLESRSRGASPSYKLHHNLDGQIESATTDFVNGLLPHESAGWERYADRR